MTAERGIRRLPSGQIDVRLEAQEHALLRAIAAELEPILTGDAPPHVRQRLFPRAYDDRQHEQEYRELTEAWLIDERRGALDAFASTLGRGQADAYGWAVELSAEEADAWLSAVNDARLTLGVLLGITVEDDYPDPDVPAGAALLYLGWLEGELIDALSGGLPPT